MTSDPDPDATEPVPAGSVSPVSRPLSAAGRLSRPPRSCLWPSRCPFAFAAVPNFPGRLVGTAGCSLFQLVGLFLVFKLQKVGYVEERVALQPTSTNADCMPGKTRVTRPL